MKTASSTYSKRLAIALSLAGMGWAGPATAQEILIGFDDPVGLSQITDAARSTFVVNQPYKEDGMVFEINVNPPDPRLGPKLIDHFHLMYERDIPVLSLTSLPHPENEPRFLATMLPGNVVQMTYHPDNTGTPQPFSIKRVRVLANAVNVGVETAQGDICVYNNLTAGYVWTLLDPQCSTNLVRVTFETPKGVYNFQIDDVVFEPYPPGTGAAPASASYTTSQTSHAAQPFVDPLTLMKLIGFNKFPPRVDIKPGQRVNTIDLASEPTLRVAVLTTKGFDAASIDPRSVRFGNGRARVISDNGHYGYLKDVDGDGDLDLLLLFRTSDVAIQCQDIYQSLKAVANGKTVIGFDFLRERRCTDDANGDLN
ncbi:hypothetical protein [Fulvimonas yonginensis]|uniref:VCBS repeat protein n=1 Tax=Fulvimonas yonginensis TaxID=1495200 RepID=A0ABU8J7T8_9GAMM